MILKKIAKALRNHDFQYIIYTKRLAKINKKRAFLAKYKFINRQKGTDELILILAGFQPEYWDVLFKNIYFANSKKRDVCICIPKGEEISHLYEIAEKYDWSILEVAVDKLSLTQNIAIKLHPQAKCIHKFDEDIVISHNYFDSLNEAKESCTKNNLEFGMLVPLININMATRPLFLKTINKDKEFVDIFGEHNKYGEFMYKSEQVAKYLTNLISSDFVGMADKVYAENRGKIVEIPVRYSIGAILFTREFWEKMGYFDVGFEGAMGLEEEQMCGYCINNFYPIVCSVGTLVGHLGYFVQKEVCKNVFLSNPEKFNTCKE